jgi:hypothetical protein
MNADAQTRLQGGVNDRGAQEFSEILTNGFE